MSLDAKTYVECATCGASCGADRVAYDISDNAYCYECCAKQDRASMVETGRALLYLTETTRTDGNMKPLHSAWHVSNWPGSLQVAIPIPPRKSRHNFGLWRLDFWFPFEGFWWHGYNIGDNQIARCKRTKRAVK